MLQDLSQYILDIAENSLKAEASRVEIEVFEDTRGDLITLKVSDNGYGMDDEQVSAIENPFFTTRTERRVGLGIPFLKQASDTCGGRFEIQLQKRLHRLPSSRGYTRHGHDAHGGMAREGFFVPVQLRR